MDFPSWHHEVETLQRPGMPEGLLNSVEQDGWRHMLRLVAVSQANVDANAETLRRVVNRIAAARFTLIGCLFQRAGGVSSW